MLTETHYKELIYKEFKGINSLKTPILFLDANLNLICCNKSCESLFDVKNKDAFQNLNQIISENHKVKLIEWWHEILKPSCSIKPLAINIKLKENFYQNFWLYASPEIIQDTHFIYKLELIQTSVYEEKYFQNELIDFNKLNQNHILTQKSKLENIIEGTNIGIWEWCILSGETSVNETWTKMIGFELENYKPNRIETWLERVHPEDLPVIKNQLSLYLKGNKKYYEGEYRMLHKNGHWIWVQDKGQIIEWTQNNEAYILFGTHTDITQQKKREIDLKKALAKLDGILKSSSQISMISTDLDGIITSFNAGSENLLGYKASELIGKETPALIHLKEEVIQSGKELSEKFNEKIENFEVFIYLAKKGEHETKEWTYVRKDGSTFPVQLTVTAIKNEDDEITGFLGVATDISNLKKTEKELKSILDLTNDQNQRLLNFAHIVSHNLRSHSSNFSMILSVLQTETDPEIIKELNELLIKASDNLNETIQNLNDVVQLNTQTNLNFSKVNIKKKIAKAMDNLSSIIKTSKAKITIAIHDDFFIDGIPAYFESILLNLMSNSIKYKQKEKNPEIKIVATQEGNQKIITFEDNGCGIDLKRHKDKIFGMYKTFHGNDDARGIGLFITKNQIEAMKGKIEIESQVGLGTNFKITFDE